MTLLQGLPRDPSSGALLVAGDPVGGGVELGYAQITVNATTTTTGVDIAGFTMTITVGTRPIMLRFGASGLSNSNGAGASIVNLQEGATVVGQGSIGALPANVAVPIQREFRLTPTPGDHTYKVNLSSFGAGTVTLAATPTSPAWLQAIQI